jgi:hypothetical protein
MKLSGVIWIIVLILLLGALGFLIYNTIPGPATLLRPTKITLPTPPPLSEAKQFFSLMRFSDRAITYSLESRCSEQKRAQMMQALTLLDSQSVLSFSEVSRGGDIVITCSNLAPDPSLEGHFVAGEGGPVEILNTSLYAVIRESKIALYKSDQCATPHVALHELLHALGFDHVNNSGSIMYPVLDCAQTLDSVFIETINDIYSVNSLPDLAIVQVNATKAGPYLAFSFEVINRGLSASKSSSLTVSAEGSVIRTFDLETLDVGTRKTLTVENLRIPRSAHTLSFSVATANSEEELSLANNNVVLEVAN